jgi:hypothetical protein
LTVRKLYATPQARDYFPPHTPEYIAVKKAQGHGMRNLNDEIANGSSPEVSLARTSPLQVRARESGESGPVFGLRCTELLAHYDPDLQLWRTLERSLFEDLPMFWDRLPRSGMMRNGRIYEQATWVRRTEGNGSGSWPTPQKDMPGAGPNNSKVQNLLTGNRHSFYLTQAVEAERQKPGVITGQLPTPRATDGNKPAYGDKNHQGLQARLAWPTPHANCSTGAGSQGRDGGDNLQTVVAKFPTPTANRRSGLQSHGVNVVTGQLNPTWVDALMGYMPGWTDGKMEYHVSLLESRNE